MYYGNSYGYGSSCGCQSVNPCYGNYNTGYYGGTSNNYAIVLVLFILLIIILGARNWV